MLTPEQIELLDKIGMIIEEAWDDAEVDDAIEYEDFIPQIYSLKENQSTVEAMAQKLFEIQNKRLKHEANMAECRIVAEKIVDL